METYSTLEARYLRQTELGHRKAFSQYFTPEPVARFMTDWALGGAREPKRLCDPAFGLGVFASTAWEKRKDLEILGWDVDAHILQVAAKAFPQAELRLGDYLQNGWDERYDAVVCNPPYRKFHDYENRAGVQKLREELGIPLSGFTNLHTLFLLKSLFQLNVGGRCAYILPSEFLNANYGEVPKRFLLEGGALRHVLVFDFKENVFPEVLTTACILLFEKREMPLEELSFTTIRSVEELEQFDVTRVTHRRCELDAACKWRAYYQPSASSLFHHLVPFEQFGKVSRGIATGANAFFVFNEAKRQAYGIAPRFFLPCITRAADVAGDIFTQADFEQLAAANRNVFLLNAKPPLDEAVARYLAKGEAEGISKRFLTAARTPWYALENRPPSPIWATVFHRKGLRFIRNEAGVHNLTTFHCVYPHAQTDLIFAYFLTEVCKEIFEENRREYGNGLRKFEPNDLNRSPVPDFRAIPPALQAQILNAYAAHLANIPGARQVLDAAFRQFLNHSGAIPVLLVT